MSAVERFADNILRAAGSSLRHYTMPATRQAILDATAEAMDEAADTITDLLAALEPFHREWLDMGATAHLADKSLMLDVDCGGEILTVGDWRKLMAAIAKAKGGAA